MTSKHGPSDRSGYPKSPPAPQPKRKRGRPEKLVKIDDSLLDVARSFYGIPFDNFNRPKTKFSRAMVLKHIIPFHSVLVSASPS